MRILCVDAEEKAREEALNLCRQLPYHPQAVGFSTAAQMLEYLTAYSADLVLMEFNLPDMDGVSMVERVWEQFPGLPIVCMSNNADRALDAWRILPHVQGFLLKPVRRQELADTIEYAIENPPICESRASVAVKTFGGFDVFVKGKPVTFARSKAKELLAYLVDRRGDWVSRREAFHALWEDRFYDLVYAEILRRHRSKPHAYAFSQQRGGYRRKRTGHDARVPRETGL